MLGGCMLDPAAPDAHTSEVHATSTLQHRCAPHRGLLQEVLVPQPHPTPLYLDSASTIFAGNDKDGITHLDIVTVHIPEYDSVANGFTKPLKSIQTKQTAEKKMLCSDCGASHGGKSYLGGACIGCAHDRAGLGRWKSELLELAR